MKSRLRSFTTALTACLMLHAVTQTGVARAEGPAPIAPLLAEPYYPSNAIMVNPLSAILGLALGVAYVSVEFQHAFTDHIGISATPGFAYFKLSDVEAYGVALEAGPRILLSGDRLHGWFVYPFVGGVYASGKNTSTHDTASVSALQIGADVGYEWNWAPGFSIGLEAGAAYTRFFGDVSNDNRIPVFPRLAVTLGYAW